MPAHKPAESPRPNWLHRKLLTRRAIISMDMSAASATLAEFTPGPVVTGMPHAFAASTSMLLYPGGIEKRGCCTKCREPRYTHFVNIGAGLSLWTQEQHAHSPAAGCVMRRHLFAARIVAPSTTAVVGTRTAASQTWPHSLQQVVNGPTCGGGGHRGPARSLERWSPAPQVVAWGPL